MAKKKRPKPKNIYTLKGKGYKRRRRFNGKIYHLHNLFENRSEAERYIKAYKQTHYGRIERKKNNKWAVYLRHK